MKEVNSMTIKQRIQNFINFCNTKKYHHTYSETITSPEQCAKIRTAMNEVSKSMNTTMSKMNDVFDMVFDDKND
jgi:hypothetical protein